MDMNLSKLQEIVEDGVLESTGSHDIATEQKQHEYLGNQIFHFISFKLIEI